MSPEPVAESFDVHADRLSTRYLRFVAWVQIAVGPGLWWTPHYLHPGNTALVAAYRYFEVGFGLAGVFTLAVLRIRSLSTNARFRLGVLNLVFLSVSLGMACGVAPMPNEVPYHAVPCAFFMMAWTARQRAISMSSAGAAFALGGLLIAPERATDLLLITAFVYYACVVFLAFFMGTILFRVVHENWTQSRALADRATALEDLSRAKTELLANVSHELRTPLTLILGALEELRQHAPEVAERGLRNTGRLTTLVDDLLQLARFEAGHAVIERKRGDLSGLVREVVRSFEPLPNGELLAHLPEQPLVAFVDPRQVRTALFNLIANAIKFSYSSSRRVEVWLEATDETAVLIVRDNGAGISKDALPHIFDRFYQADASATRRHGGVGIGLALTHEIVILHGGTITVDSEVGVGSSFRIQLPRQLRDAVEEPNGAAFASFDSARRWGATAVLRAAALEPKGLPSNSGDGRPLVLVAEDDADLRDYLAQLVSREHRVLTARDGAEAERLFDEHSPDLVLADLMMPGRTGVELLRHVRAAGRTPRVPVLVLTARTEVQVRLQVFEAGADDYVAKPFDEGELLARIRLLLKLAEQERELADRNTELSRRVIERTDQLRRLATHLDASREDERRRIARELHDELGQLLTGMRMEMAALRQAGGAPSREATAQSIVCDRIDGLLDQAFAASRNLVYELRPRVLDDLGLIPALEWYVDRFRERSGLSIALHVATPREPSPALATTLFRALQESLTNVARHAGAARISVTLLDAGDRLALTVEDDGCGFEVENVSGGFGVLGLRERAFAAGGTFAIKSGRGRGTRVVFAVPWETTPQGQERAGEAA